MPRTLKQVVRTLSPAFARPRVRSTNVYPVDKTPGTAPAQRRGSESQPRQRRKSKETVPLWAQGDATFETDSAAFSNTPKRITSRLATRCAGTRASSRRSMAGGA
eukprot:930683-Prymnesium_polylepis.2